MSLRAILVQRIRVGSITTRLQTAPSCISLQLHTLTTRRMLITGSDSDQVIFRLGTVIVNVPSPPVQPLREIEDISYTGLESNLPFF